MLFSWEHQKYQNTHPGAHFGTSLGGSWGGRRVPPCSCSTNSDGDDERPTMRMLDELLYAHYIAQCTVHLWKQTNEKKPGMHMGNLIQLLTFRLFNSITIITVP